MSSIECRICDNCGTQNDPGQLECTKCGCDLSFLPITWVDESSSESSDSTEQKEETVNTGWGILAKDNPDISLQIKDQVMIGREEDILNNYLSSSTYVSREHATLSVEQNELYVVDASTNGTFINGNRINKLKKYKLEKGDLLAFADKEFIVTYAD